MEFKQSARRHLRKLDAQVVSCRFGNNSKDESTVFFFRTHCGRFISRITASVLLSCRKAEGPVCIVSHLGKKIKQRQVLCASK